MSFSLSYKLPLSRQEITLLMLLISSFVSGFFMSINPGPSLGDYLKERAERAEKAEKDIIARFDFLSLNKTPKKPINSDPKACFEREKSPDVKPKKFNSQSLKAMTGGAKRYNKPPFPPPMTGNYQKAGITSDPSTHPDWYKNWLDLKIHQYDQEIKKFREREKEIWTPLNSYPPGFHPYGN